MLLEFATNEFELAQPQADGHTLREHLASAERSMHQPIARLHAACPPLVEVLWGWYRELSAARTGNGAGPNPITFSDIRAWSELMGVRLNAFETLALRMIDSVYFEVMAKARNQDG